MMDAPPQPGFSTRIKTFFPHPASFFCVALPVPLWCAALRFMAMDDAAGSIGWFLPLLALAFLLAAGVMLGVTIRRKREALPSVSTLWKLAGVAVLFCALGDYHLYKTVFLAGTAEIVAVISSSILMTMGGICLFWSGLGKWSLALWLPFVLLGMLQEIGFLEYGAVLNSLVLAETLETNMSEALAYLTFANISFILLALLLVGGMGWMLCRVLRGCKRMPLANAGALLSGLSIAIALSVPLQGEDTDTFWPYAEGYRVYLMVEEALNYNEATIECVKNLPSSADQPSSLPTLRGDEGVVLVIHIGESVRADRLSINGYPRPTTPWLSSLAGGCFINFPRCISSSCDTCEAQITILTDGRRNTSEQDPALRPHVGSVLDLFAANGFDVHCFRGIRCGEKLKFDMVFYLLTRCAKQRHYAPGSPWTGIPEMDKVLAANKEGKNQVWFINNEGSHTPFFHYDHDNPPFLPAIDSFEVPSSHAEEINNAYDNTIHYTDEYIHRVVDRLQGRPFVYVYVSDHGEYLGHDGMWGRGALGSNRVTYHSTDGCLVGMFVIYSPEFERLHPHFAEAIRQLSEHAGMTVAHEHIFHTLLGLFNLQTPCYNEELDLCSPHAKPYDGPQPE